MGFLSLLKVASMPILQVLIISIVGAFMATDYLKLLPPVARSSMNKVGYRSYLKRLVDARNICLISR